ncbi:hypothetical protein LHYA1_G003487 [Lachnellula hyalina]|uniref:Uncharacterized protein n=1 Tax=Lachnellula hyalina TaxID=1316788 RepID=A0A8H8TZ71_9HELO|nr:uncharacterized protein LHYA1_G003487 [Lachnellula hyalina]TVY27984.1 hypothetical protein LHYA1_G003487 [Lachnellula hyalina]
MLCQLFLLILVSILSNSKMSTATQVPSGTYRAPLHNCDYESLVPNSYVIYLTPGHSLEQHSEAVGKDMKPLVHHVFDMYTEKVVYVGRPVDGSLLEAIRADEGVELVECEDEPQLDDELEKEL